LKSKGTIAFVPIGSSYFVPSNKPLEAAAGMYMLQPSVVTEEIPLTDAEFNVTRRQYDAESVIKKIFAQGKPHGINMVIGITEKDLFVHGSNFVFGLADPQRGIGMTSLARLRQNSDPKLLEERLMKEVAHEIGHLVGLKHCPNLTCVMSFANTISDVDSKLPMLCKDCLAQVGIKF